jgi:ADP-L-glycero-D-manno-heptose 6-epimerase
MYIVTGAAGFIGSNLLAVMAGRGLGPLVAVDRCDSEHKRRNIAKRALAHMVAPEHLLDFLNQATGEVKALIHLGALTSTVETDLEALQDTNVRLSRALWMWCARTGVPFLYASSAATYGDGAAGFDDNGSLAALSKLRPLNAYAQSKHDFDLWVADQWQRGIVLPPQWVGLKFFNVYGPNEFHKGSQGSLVPQIHPVASRGDAYPLFKSHRAGIADGAQARDFIFVDDCSDAMLWFLSRPKVSGLFNMGTGRARTFADLAAAVYRALGRDPLIVYRETPAELQRHYQYFTEAKMDRLRAVGYTTPFTTLEDGVARTVQGYLELPDPYR